MTTNGLRTMLAKYLKLTTSSAHGGDPVPDPLIKFHQALKAGIYKRMPPDKLAALKADIAEESELFYEEDTAYPADILIRALYNTDLSYKTCLIAADAIANAVAEKDKATDHNQEESKFMTIPEGVDDELPFFTMEEERALKSLTPQAIFDRLSKDVYSQNDAKKALAMLAYNHIHDRPSSLLIAGPTGSGKSAMIESLQKIPGIDVRILDGSRLAPDGYKGSQHLQDAFPPNANHNCILIIDEFDKACETHIGSNGTNYSQMTLNQILLLLEHRQISFSANGNSEQSYSVDTSHVSVILCGAWENLLRQKDNNSGGIGFGAPAKKIHDFGNTSLTTNDYIKYGVRPEICGRITDFCMLSPMTTADFRRILDEESLSPIARISKEYKVKLTVSDALKDTLAHEAYSSGLGCRTIYSNLKRRLNHEMFRDCNRREYFLDERDPFVNIGTRKPAQAVITANADQY